MFSQFSQLYSQSGFFLDWDFFCPYLCSRILREESSSVAPAGFGNHLAIGPVTLQMFTSCDVKTILRSDRKMKVGKEYPGVFRLDGEGFVEDFLSRDAHYTFTETLPWTMKRNPHVFSGRYISITRRSDGSLRPNFRPVKMDDGFSVDHYADGVRYELLLALGGLVGEK